MLDETVFKPGEDISRFSSLSSIHPPSITDLQPVAAADAIIETAPAATDVITESSPAAITKTPLAAANSLSALSNGITESVPVATDVITNFSSDVTDDVNSALSEASEFANAVNDESAATDISAKLAVDGSPEPKQMLHK